MDQGVNSAKSLSSQFPYAYYISFKILIFGAKIQLIIQYILVYLSTEKVDKFILSLRRKVEFVTPDSPTQYISPSIL